MAALSPDVSAALASLQARWGAAAPRVVGALATAPLPEEQEAPAVEPRTGVERIVRTGFPALDAILGPGGLPRSASVALRGDASSGKTTLALRLAAEAQADGAIVDGLDRKILKRESIAPVDTIDTIDTVPACGTWRAFLAVDAIAPVTAVLAITRCGNGREIPR